MTDKKSTLMDPSSDRNAQYYEPTGFGEYGKYMHNKRGKLQIQQDDNRESAKSLGLSYPQIFKDMVIYLNGHAGVVSISQLSQLVTLHGGTWLPYMDRKKSVTHILATNLTHKKMEEFKSYRVVLPTWIVDSVKEGKVLDWRDYRLSSHTLPFNKDTPDTSVFGEEDGANPGGSVSRQKNLLGIFKSNKPSELHARASSISKKTSEENIRPSRTIENTTMITDLSNESEHSENSIRPRQSSYNQGTDPANPKLAFAARCSNYYPSKSNTRASDLVSDSAWRLQHTAANPDFVENYFKSSRLHYLSTSRAKLPFMIARLKKELNMLSETNNSCNKCSLSKKPLSGTADDGRVIWHVDIDCFFVSAGLVSHPELRGKPVAVCHSGEHQDADQSTSEIASCSYEARSFGVKNGMSLHRAKSLCPSILTIPYDFKAYETVSETFYRTLLKYADELQPVSVDEVFMDVTTKVGAGETKNELTIMQLAEEIRTEIKDLTGCEVSIGSGCNMLIARLATRKAKPASAFHVSHDSDTIKSFLASHNVNDLPGVGYSIRERLQEHFGVSTVKQLAGVNKTQLQDFFGPQQGETLFNAALGIDPRPLVSIPPARKSVSAEINYGIRLDSQEEVERFIVQLSREVSKRLKDCELRSSHITLNVMIRHPDMQSEPPKFLGHGPCITHSKTHSMGVATDNADVIKSVSWKLLEGYKFNPRDLRGVGIQMQKLKASINSIDPEPSQPQLNFLQQKVCEAITNEDAQHSGDGMRKQQEPLFQPEVVKLSLDTDSTVPKVLGKRRVSESSEDDIIIIEDVKKKKVDSPDIISICELPTMSQMDVDVYKALPDELQKEVMDAISSKQKQRAKTLSPEKKKATATLRDTFTITKPGVASSSNRQARISKRGRLIAPAQQQKRTLMTSSSKFRPPSPKQLGDAQLGRLGIVDVGLFRSLPRTLQIESLSHSWQSADEKIQEEVLGVRRQRRHTPQPSTEQNREGEKKRNNEDTEKNKDSEQPGIFGKYAIEDIQDMLEIWVDKKWREGPHESDLEHIFKGLCGMICVDKNAKKRRVQDLDGVSKIMLWWRMLIRDQHQLAKANYSKQHIEWEKAFDNIMKRLNVVIVKENGGVLTLR